MQARMLVSVFVLVAVAAGVFLAQQTFWPGSPDRIDTSGQGVTTGETPVSVDPAAAEVSPDPASAAAEVDAAHQRQAVAGDAEREDPAALIVRLTGRLIDRDSKPTPGHVLRFDVQLDGIQGLVPANVPPMRATSDDAGQFVLSVPRGCDGILALEREGYLLLSGTARLADVDEDRDLGDVVVLAQSRVSGRVVDPRGQPVAGVKVSASGRLFGGTPASTSTSADDGSFSLDMLHPGEWHVRTASGQHLPTQLTLQMGPEEQLRDLELTVEPGRWVSGYVIDDRGQPIEGAKVGSVRQQELSGMKINRFALDETVLTDKRGWFSLAGLKDDQVDIRAFGAGHVADTQRGVEVGTTNLQLRLLRQGEVVGVLQDASGQPIAGSRVTALSGNSMPSLDEEEMELHFGRMPLGRMQDAAVTGEDGSFRIANVEPGSVTVRATGQSHRPARLAGLVVAPGQVHEGVVVVADRGGVARVLVVNEAGEPVASAEVTVMRALQQPIGSFHIVAESTVPSFASPFGSADLGRGTTNADGVVEIGGLPDGTARLVCSHADYAESRALELVVPARGVADARLVVRRAGFVEVQVVDADGQPMAAKFVVHGPVGNGENGRDRQNRAGADGTAHVGPLPPGAYWAELLLPQQEHSFHPGDMPHWPGPRGPVLESTRREFKVTADQVSQMQLEMPPLVRVHGVVRSSGEPVAGIKVELVESSPTSANAEAGSHGVGAKSVKTDANGQYSLQDVVPGDYEIRWGKPKQIVMDRQKLMVGPTQREMHRDLNLSYGDLRVRVVDVDGNPIKGAEVELSRGDASSNREARSVSISMVMTSDGSEESASVVTGPRKAKTDAEGIALVEEVPPGTYQVRASSSRFIDGKLAGQVVVEGVLTESGTVQLLQSGRLRGEIVDTNGDRVSLALVMAQKVGGEDPPRPHPALGGTYLLDRLAPGKYLVKASRMGNGAMRAQGPELEVEVVGGETASLRLSVPPQ